jgi:hypothetical protein
MSKEIDRLCDQVNYWVTQGNVGYDQSNRYALRQNGETDCSWLILGSMKQIGMSIGNATYTGNMVSELTQHGWKIVEADGHPQRGDILLNITHHTALWLGTVLAQASIDENGRATGGKTGDQTNKETNTRGYYNYPWDLYLRYKGNNMADDLTAALYTAKGTDNRNLFDSIIQTRNELRDRAQEGAQKALIAQKGNDGRNILDSCIQIRWNTEALTAQVAALSEAVKTLATTQGADPDAVAKAVSDAVTAKLESLKINVEES